MEGVAKKERKLSRKIRSCKYSTYSNKSNMIQKKKGRNAKLSRNHIFNKNPLFSKIVKRYFWITYYAYQRCKKEKKYQTEKLVAIGILR